MARHYDANHLVLEMTLAQLKGAISRYDAGQLPAFPLRKPTSWHFTYRTKNYPVKNLCAMAIGHRPASFNTHYAISRLETLNVECWPSNPIDVRSDDAEDESQRLRRWGTVASRPGQLNFALRVREIYNRTCAITGCTAPEALQAAHIRTQSGSDNNHATNGILLRADVHALFDAGRISLTPDGKRVEVASDFKDNTYAFLKKVRVFRPKALAPSLDHIAWHRKAFGF